MKKLISICIPTYNRCDKVIAAILSAINIKSKLIEIVVFDNSSQDNTWLEINKLDDCRLKLFRQTENQGFCRNLLDVVAKAEGEFVFLLSDDDLVEPAFVDRLIEQKMLNSSSVGIIYGSIYKPHNSSFYLEYANTHYQGKNAISNVLLKHAYMSGMILNRNEIDLSLLNQLALDEQSLMYPQEIMVMSIIKNEKTILTLSDTCCYQGLPGVSHIVNESKYYYFTERIFLFNQYIRIMELVFEKEQYKKAMRVSIASLAAGFILNSSNLVWGKGFFNKLKNKIHYYKALNIIDDFAIPFNTQILKLIPIKIINLLHLKPLIIKVLGKRK